MSYNQMARVTSLESGAALRPERARATSRAGLDADLALVDPRDTWTIRAEDSPSTQGYTPFEGHGAVGAGERDVPARQAGPAKAGVCSASRAASTCTGLPRECSVSPA